MMSIWRVGLGEGGMSGVKINIMFLGFPGKYGYLNQELCLNVDQIGPLYLDVNLYIPQNNVRRGGKQRPLVIPGSIRSKISNHQGATNIFD